MKSPFNMHIFLVVMAQILWSKIPAKKPVYHRSERVISKRSRSMIYMVRARRSNPEFGFAKCALVSLNMLTFDKQPPDAG